MKIVTHKQKPMLIQNQKKGEIMEKINMDEVYNKIENLCIKLKRNINKSDIKKENGFLYGYTTYVNAGLRLRDFPFFEILYNENPKLCQNCNNKIPYSRRENIYCSSSCSASINNKKRVRKTKKEKVIRREDLKIKVKKEKKVKEKIKICKHCGMEHKEKYFAVKCFQRVEFINKIRMWCLGEDISGGKIIQNPVIIKRIVIVMNGYKCERCGISDSYNNKPLILHLEHIDGDATNNKKDNVCLLCPNCHSLTPTFKGKNIGNGKREWRKKRYHEGKSY